MQAPPTPSPSVPSNTYQHPRPGPGGRLLQAIVNAPRIARWRRALMSRLPFMRLASDVSDVVYLTWLVPVTACAHLVPPGVRLWQREGLTPFTALTYRHAHFGPSLAGPLRWLFPSPLQSNWRLYLADAPKGVAPVRTVLFLKNVMDSVVYTFATRMFSDALRTHLAARFVHVREGDLLRTDIQPGEGSAPALSSTVRRAGERVLPPGFGTAFDSWRAAVEFLACQDAAVAPVDLDAGRDALAFAEIRLPIDVPAVLPAQVVGEPPRCAALAELPPVHGPFCFVVTRVPFQVVSERVILTERSGP